MLALQKKWRYIILTFTLIGIVILLFNLIFHRWDYFKVKNIIVNDLLVSEPMRRAILKKNENKELFLLDLKELQNRVQTVYSAQQVQITKKYPDSLSIKILNNDLICYLMISGRKGFFGIDTDKRIINKRLSLPKQYPVIKMDLVNLVFEKRNEGLSIANSISNKEFDSVVGTLSILYDLNKIFFQKIESIFLFKDGKKNYLLLRDLKSRFYFGKKLTLSQLIKIYSLKEDLSTHINYRTIDLRFHDIVVRN